MSGNGEPSLTADQREMTAAPAHTGSARTDTASESSDVSGLIAMAVRRIAEEVQAAAARERVVVAAARPEAGPARAVPVEPASAGEPILDTAVPVPDPARPMAAGVEDSVPAESEGHAFDDVAVLIDRADAEVEPTAAVTRIDPTGDAPPSRALGSIGSAPSGDRSTGAGLTRSWLSGWTWRGAAKVAAGVVAGYFALVFALIVLYRVVNPPFSTLMAYQWLTGTQIARTWVPIEDISPNLMRAVVVSEDWGFCNHYGIDLAAIERALEQAGEGVPRGASTISMQVIKNLFLTQSKSYVRKAVEIPLTFVAELVWPKSRMLEIYLNIAEWGPGIFGAEAAARHHFSKSAAKLSEREAALLAAALPNPMIRDAGDPGPRTARKASVIQARMRAAGPVADCAMPRRAENRGFEWETTVKKRAGAVPGL